MNIDHISAIVSFPFGLIGLLSLYLSDTARWELPFWDSYKGLYGKNYEMFNISRENVLAEDGQPRLVHWDVEIEHRWLKTPRFKMTTRANLARFVVSYSGRVIYNGGRMVMILT